MGLLLAFALFVQDPEARYREALYQEVDKGELEKALALYRQVETDAQAPEVLRARSAFRKAWCLEKMGQKAEAQSAYHAMERLFPAQAEILKKVRERMDRLDLPEAPPQAPLSQEDRIEQLILSLGNPFREASMGARRTLILLGDPAVPALRRALKHKDLDLRTEAASVLVELEQDEGTFPILFGAVVDMDSRRRSSDAPQALEKLLKRRPELLREFLDGFAKEKDPIRIERYVRFLGSSPIPEARARLKELLLTLEPVGVEFEKLGSKFFKGQEATVVEAVARALRDVSQDELLDLLGGMIPLKDGPARARILLAQASVRVTRVRDLARQIVKLFPCTGDWDVSRLSLPVDQAIQEALLLEGGSIWLRSPSQYVRGQVEALIRSLEARRFEVLLGLFDEKLGDPERLWILEEAGSEPRPADEPMRSAVVKSLLAAFDREHEGLKGAASNGLLALAPENHPRWEELILWQLEQPLPESGKPAFKPGPAATQCEIPRFYRRFTPSGRDRVRGLVYKRLSEGDEAARTRALALFNLFKTRDADAFAVLDRVVRNASLSPKLRLGALGELMGYQADYPGLQKTMEDLCKDPDSALRRKALYMRSLRRSPETDKILLPLIDDPDTEVADLAAAYFEANPTPEHFPALVRALRAASPVARNLGASGLGALESMKAVPALIEALEDSEAPVRVQARGALERIRKRYEEKYQWQEWYDRVKPKEK